MINNLKYYKKIWLQKRMDRIALYISILLFSLSNLGFFKMIFNICGLGDYSTIVSVFLFCILDIILLVNYLFTLNYSNIKSLYILIMTNIIYCFPNFVKLDIYLIIQYIVFVLPFTLVIGFIYNKNAISIFFNYTEKLSKYIFFLAIIYTIILFSGNFTYNGYVRLDVFSYGDIAYALLPFLISDLMYFIDTKKKIILFRCVFYFVVIIYTGTRSAIMCCALAYIICLFIFFTKSNKSKKEVMNIMLRIVIICLILFGLINAFLPEGSRLNVVKDNFIYELGNKNKLYVYDVINKQTKDINSVFEYNIVNNSYTKDETEKILHDDIKNKTGKYIIVEDNKNNEAEQFTYKYNRPNLWNTAFKEFLKHPVFGNGIFHYQSKYVGTFPHNLVLEIMADFGLIGLFVIIWFIYGIIQNLFKSIKRGNNSDWKLYVFILSYFPQYILYTTLYNNGIFIFSILALVYSILINKKKGIL